VSRSTANVSARSCRRAAEIRRLLVGAGDRDGPLAGERRLQWPRLASRHFVEFGGKVLGPMVSASHPTLGRPA
jgi:hypothetical protein